MVLQGWHCRDGAAGMTLQGRRWRDDPAGTALQRQLNAAVRLDPVFLPPSPGTRLQAHRNVICTTHNSDLAVVSRLNAQNLAQVFPVSGATAPERGKLPHRTVLDPG